MTASSLTEIPSANELRRMREELGLSQSELANALGFSANGAKVIRDWEHGDRADQPFKPNPTSWAAFRYLALLVDIYRRLGPTDPLADRIRGSLPAALR